MVFAVLKAPDGSPILWWYAGKLDGSAIATDLTEAELKSFYVYWMELGLERQRDSLDKGLEPDGVMEVYDLYGTGISMLTSSGIRMFAAVLGCVWLVIFSPLKTRNLNPRAVGTTGSGNCTTPKI